MAHTPFYVLLYQKGTLSVSVSQTEWERDSIRYIGSFPVSDGLSYGTETV